MEYRTLGRSGLKVSALSIGTVTFGNDGSWGNTELKDAQRQIDLASGAVEDFQESLVHPDLEGSVPGPVELSQNRDAEHPRSDRIQPKLQPPSDRGGVQGYVAAESGDRPFLFVHDATELLELVPEGRLDLAGRILEGLGALIGARPGLAGTAGDDDGRAGLPQCPRDAPSQPARGACNEADAAGKGRLAGGHGQSRRIAAGHPRSAAL